MFLCIQRSKLLPVLSPSILIFPTAPPQHASPVKVSLIFFPNETEGIRADPEPGKNLLLQFGFELVDQPHLLLGVSLHREELDHSCRLVDVDPDGGGGRQPDVDVLAVVPDLVAGAWPAHPPGAFVLPETAGHLLGFTGCALGHQANHHPAVVVHLPVASEAHQPLLTKHLREERFVEPFKSRSSLLPVVYADYREVFSSTITAGMSSLWNPGLLPAGSPHISQAGWGRGRLRRMSEPLWSRPQKSTTASELFCHPGRWGANLRRSENDFGVKMGLKSKKVSSQPFTGRGDQIDNSCTLTRKTPT